MFRRLVFIIIILICFWWLPLAVRAAAIDSDSDGLSDDLESKFKTDINNSDTDGDGYADGLEIKNGYDPLQGDGAKLTKGIVVNLKKQQLTYYLSDVAMGVFPVSTGKATMPTPKGTFQVANKSVKAWSRTYKLWMPYWLGIKGQAFGIHELPIWPSGKKEGEKDLGHPVSHGCIRLGAGPAKIIYDFATVGTKVIVE